MHKVYCLLGPTASGKTAIAMQLAEKYPFEIISVDSAMVYQDMNIGTAKPSPLELILSPHHLIDIRTPQENYSVAEFRKDALALIKAILQRNKIPLLVGGTMMYFHALQQGLASLPEKDDLIRAVLSQQLHTEGLEQLYQELSRVDPITALKLNKNDKQRILRALEVYRLTQKPLSELVALQEKEELYAFENILIYPENRALLHIRIEQRFEVMLQQGFVEEVRELQKKWSLNPGLTSMRSVGYRQALLYLEGKISYAEFVAQAIAATRQLAKRQLTWLRRWESGVLLPQEEGVERIVMRILRERV